MYKLENIINSVIQDDCMNVLRELPDKSIDLILTDPPYAGAGMKYESYDDTNIDDTTKLVLDFLKEARRVAKIVIFPSGKFLTEIKLYQLYPPQWRLCWHKGAGHNLSPVGFNDWEMMMIYGEKICVNQHDHFTATNNERMGNYGHPCPKPLKWAEWIISRFSKEGNIILDTFVGSGTVLVASKKLKRNFIGIDLEPKYCEIARQRLRQGILL